MFIFVIDNNVVLGVDRERYYGDYLKSEYEKKREKVVRLLDIFRLGR